MCGDERSRTLLDEFQVPADRKRVVPQRRARRHVYMQFRKRGRIGIGHAGDPGMLAPHKRNLVDTSARIAATAVGNATHRQNVLSSREIQVDFLLGPRCARAVHITLRSAVHVRMYAQPLVFIIAGSHGHPERKTVATGLGHIHRLRHGYRLVGDVNPVSQVIRTVPGA